MDWEAVVDTLVAKVLPPDLGLTLVGSLSLALLTGLSWISPKTGNHSSLLAFQQTEQDL